MNVNEAREKLCPLTDRYCDGCGCMFWVVKSELDGFCRVPVWVLK